MAEQEESSFPTQVVWAQYHEEGTNPEAVARQFDVVGTQFPEQALEWGEIVCKAVDFPRCEHTSCPPPLAGAGSLEERKAEAAGHPGLCGVYHACFITGVKFADVAERGNGVAMTRGFRNGARANNPSEIFLVAFEDTILLEFRV